MKKLLIFLFVSSLMGCGISESEKIRIAEIACSSLSATSEKDTLDRMQIINTARQELSEEIFSGSTQEVERYLRFGTCFDFILNRNGFKLETSRRDLAFNQMVKIANSEESKQSFPFDIVTDDGEYFFMVSEKSDGKYQEHILDSKSFTKLQNMLIKGYINIRTMEFDDDKEQVVWKGKLEQGRIELTVVKGKFQGEAKLWHDNGNLKTVSNYTNGALNGMYEMWDKKGVLIVKGKFEDGYRVGKHLTWHGNAQKKSEGEYIDGAAVGKHLMWHDNGQKESEGEYIDGAAVGKHLSWYDNGQKKSEVEYVNDKREGKYLYWFSNGDLVFEWNYKDGKRQGKGRSFDEEECYKDDEEVDMNFCT